MAVWIVEEREGYTDRTIDVTRFATAEKAIKYYNTQANENKELWKHYFTYPKRLIEKMLSKQQQEVNAMQFIFGCWCNRLDWVLKALRVASENET